MTDSKTRENGVSVGLGTDATIEGGGDSFAFLILLGASTVRLGGCLYLPAIPFIGERLAISDANMAATVTYYFLGFALCGLLAGPFSDAYGRKVLIVGGALVFVVGSLVCGMADSFATLLFGRVLQSFGAGMIPGTARAMVRDHCDDARVVSLMGWLSVLGVVMFVGAPALGGLLTLYFGWRSNFVFLAGFGFLVGIVLLLWLPETLDLARRSKLSPRTTLANYVAMLLAPEFTLVTLPLFLSFVFQGAYIAGASFVFVRELGVSPAEFGGLNVVLVFGLILGRQIAVSMAKAGAVGRAFVIGGLAAPFAGALFAYLAVSTDSGGRLYVLLGALFMFSMSMGIVTPISMKSAITAFRERSGETASLQAFAALFGSAVGGALFAWTARLIPEVSALVALSYVSVAVSALLPIATFLGREKLR